MILHSFILAPIIVHIFISDWKGEQETYIANVQVTAWELCKYASQKAD